MEGKPSTSRFDYEPGSAEVLTSEDIDKSQEVKIALGKCLRLIAESEILTRFKRVDIDLESGLKLIIAFRRPQDSLSVLEIHNARLRLRMVDEEVVFSVGQRDNNQNGHSGTDIDPTEFIPLPGYEFHDFFVQSVNANKNPRASLGMNIPDINQAPVFTIH